MGWVISMAWLSALIFSIGMVSFALSTAAGRKAAIFALPQHRSIGQSKFVSKNGFARNLYQSIWHPDAPALYHKGKIDLEQFDPACIENCALVSGGRKARFAKRAVDVFISLTMLVFMAPLLLVIAFAVRLDSPGPALYRQKRIGRNGSTFTVIKFRSMRTDAEKEGAQWAAENDSRVTRLGRFIRRTRLDELPQLWPVLIGEMSFVGPRPERPVFVPELAEQIPHFDLRHKLKPGLTGWAQVNYPYGASVEDSVQKLRYDLYYIQHQSMVLDWFIIIKTIRVAVLGVGGR